MLFFFFCCHRVIFYSFLLQISGYTLTVQAEDNGNPPRRNMTTVNIDVSDVNDNPPLFSKGNYSVIIQVIALPFSIIGY